MRKYVFWFLVALWGCGNSTEINNDTPLIVCTTGMIADAASELTDGKATVVALMGPGTDPHLFKPTKESLDLLSSADIIIANGLRLEGRMEDILEKLSRQKTVLFVGEQVPSGELIHTNRKIPDPHLWFDVSLWRNALNGLAGELEKAGVLNSASTKSYLNDLDELHAWVRESLSEIPKEHRVLITAHDAFSYFGRAYDVEVVGLQGISTVAEYGLRDVGEMVDMIVRRGIKAVYVESSIAPRSMEAVVAGCQRRGHEVVIGGTLYGDAPGGKGSGAETYVGMVKHNVTTIINHWR